MTSSPHYIYPSVQEAEGVAELVDGSADVIEAGAVEVEHLQNYCVQCVYSVGKNNKLR